MKKSFLIAALCALFFSCNNSSDAPIIPPQPQETKVKTSDWLFLCYFDADDGSINDDLYRNIRDIECAFAQTRNEDGSPKDGYANVTALVLWDGISQEAKGEEQKFIHPDGALYEIGADYSLEYVPQSGNEFDSGYVTLGDGFSVGPNTKNLTSKARGWLKKEPDMSDPATLTNFLKWAKAHYDAPNVVLCLQDHGAGTYKETYTDTTAVSKALCTDATNGGDRMLSCKNITDALAASGWTGDKKPKILWNDLCLQATAEIVWNYKGCADYFCASPNVSWMPDYYGVFTNIKSGMTALDVGKVMVSAYMHRYYKDPMPCPSAGEDPRNTRASGCSMYTASFISLDPQKVNELKDKVDGLADSLLAIKNTNESLFNLIYENHVKQDISSLEYCNGLAYNGTYALLNDLGWLCADICDDDDLSAAHASAAALQNFLNNGDDEFIIYSWGGRRATKDKENGAWKDDSITTYQTYLTGQTDFISKEPVEVEDNADCYGLTIVGSVREFYYEGDKEYPFFRDDSNIILHYDDWTGFSESWGKVINAWWDYYKTSN